MTDISSSSTIQISLWIHGYDKTAYSLHWFLFLWIFYNSYFQVAFFLLKQFLTFFSLLFLKPITKPKGKRPEKTNPTRKKNHNTKKWHSSKSYSQKKKKDVSLSRTHLRWMKHTYWELTFIPYQMQERAYSAVSKFTDH